MSRLSVTLDGKPVHLYEFVQGSYEDRRNFICAHAQDLPRAVILARVRAALRKLPEEIEQPDYSRPPEPDLFQQALTLAGFVFVDDEIPIGLLARSLGVPTTARRWLERSLDDWEQQIGL